jgi:hypothetical protein
MNKIIFYTIVLLISFVGKAIAQEKTFEERAKEISIAIQKITTTEKNALKQEIEAIDKQVTEKLITKEQADELKMKAAEIHAANIETKVAIEEEKLNQLVQDKVYGKYKTTNFEHILRDSIIIKGKKYEVIYEVTDSTQMIKDFKRIFNKNKIPTEKRTTTQFVLATGFNNLVTNGAVANSDFGYLRSQFVEWGITFRSNLFKDKKVLNLKYGLSFMYNNLHATDNRIFVANGTQTNLELFPFDLKDNRAYFKNVYVTIPLHLEFDFSKVKTRNDKKYYESHTGFRFGIGGFVGYNINSKQFLDYKVDGYRNSIRQKGNWNVNDWNYGLSTYIGYRQTSLYVKYDINPLFKNNTIDQNNVSLGVRFDFN